MYASVKRLALTCGIFCAVNIVGTILCFLAMPNFDLGFSVEFAIGCVMITLCLIALFLTIATHNLCLLLELEYEDTAGKLRNLNKKISELEEKV